MDFIVLGIYEGHTASAAVMVNGVVLAAAAEERFSRLKVDFGFPRFAVEYCLKQTGIAAQDIDKVVLVGDRFGPQDIADTLLKRAATYSVDDWVKENQLYWKPKLLEGRTGLRTYFDLMGGFDRVKGHHYDLSLISFDDNDDVMAANVNKMRLKAVFDYVGVTAEKVAFVPHYLCHPYYAYYASPLRGDNVAVIHAEGSGGRYNSTVYRPTTQGLHFLDGTGQCDVGRVYHWLTLVLGMKPEQHEYKIMGLAPYANVKEVEKSFPVFKDLFQIDGILIKYKNRPRDLYFHFRDKLEGHRFDGIAGALQQATEDILMAWVETVGRTLGCRRFVYGGGVALNVKANGKIAELDCVDDFFVPGSPGDETNCIGACYKITEEHCLANNLDLDALTPLSHMYLGPSFNRADVDRAIEVSGITGSFRITEGVGPGDIASELAANRVVGRIDGRMELGVRALGNRSILANPSERGIVRKINDKIKYRDFWMPFCPTVLDRRQHDYLVNPKGIRSPYMTMAFPATGKGRTDIPAALHPADDTGRPQVLVHDVNPDYYSIIEKFEEKTGLGVVLNTSFNLHGQPIVCSPGDGIEAFLNSEIDSLVMGDVMVSRS